MTQKFVNSQIGEKSLYVGKTKLCCLEHRGSRATETHVVINGAEKIPWLHNIPVKDIEWLPAEEFWRDSVEACQCD